VANYKLIDPANAANFLVLTGVTDDSFVDDRERVSMVVIGRGRKVNYGTKLGKTGTLVIKIRERAGESATAQRDALEAFLATYPDVILESPWADQWYVDIGPISVTRISGTGDSEAVDISFPYEELDADL
jgi:hypothetical protein